MTRPRVLHLCSWYPNRVHPYNGNFIKKHLRAAACVSEVLALQVEEDPRLAPGAVEATKLEGRDFQGQIIYFRSRWDNPLWRQLTKWRLYLRFARPLMPEVDVVHVHVMFPALAAGWRLARRWNRPLVVSEHSWAFLPGSPHAYPRWLEWMLVQWANGAGAVCPVSDVLAKQLRVLGLKAPVNVIPNVVAERYFYPAKAVAARPFRWLHLSNFDPEVKNPEGIMRAFAQLPADAAQLVMAGDGDAANLKKLAAALGLNDRISFLGPLSEEEVGQLMRQCHALVLFSRWETQSVVALEAQCCGLPVLATRLPALEELIETATLGRLTHVGDEIALAEAMSSIMKEHPSFDPSKIAARGQERYGQAAIARQFQQLYQSLMA
jgi:glycosyltransferase involved in cell wall biosynthesis